MTKLTHDEIASLIDKYHKRAIELFNPNSNVYPDYTIKISISNTKNVQLTENGAFVEAMIFIPKEEIE